MDDLGVALFLETWICLKMGYALADYWFITHFRRRCTFGGFLHHFQTQPYHLPKGMTGWCFGTCLFFHAVGNFIIPTDFHALHHKFQRGRAKKHKPEELPNEKQPVFPCFSERPMGIPPSTLVAYWHFWMFISVQSQFSSGWWFQTWILWLPCHKKGMSSWQNWRTPSFFKIVIAPPTRLRESQGTPWLQVGMSATYLSFVFDRHLESEEL